MRTFVIFDRKSGEILETHVTTDDIDDDAEDLMRMVRSEGDERATGVLEVGALESGVNYTVDVKANKLARGDKVANTSAAGVQQVGGDPRSARIVVTRSGA